MNLVYGLSTSDGHLIINSYYIPAASFGQNIIMAFNSPGLDIYAGGVH